MILRVSVRDAVTLAAHDIELTAEPDSSVASLLASLPFQVGDRRCYVGAEPLDPDASLADSPLVAGATISIGAPGPHPRIPAGAVGACGSSPVPTPASSPG